MVELCALSGSDLKIEFRTILLTSIETTVPTSYSYKYAVLHSQLWRFACRCARKEHFVDAASRLTRDIYDPKLLAVNYIISKLLFWRTFRTFLATPDEGPRRMFSHKLTLLDINTKATRLVALNV